VEGKKINILKEGGSMPRYLRRIVIVTIILVVSFVLSVLEKHETKKEVHQLSKNAQITQDYLSGKEIAGKDAWWLNIDNDAFSQALNSMTAQVSSELKFDYIYVLRQIRPENFVIIHRPEKEPGKK
jgi:hypothetical protein